MVINFCDENFFMYIKVIMKKSIIKCFKFIFKEVFVEISINSWYLKLYRRLKIIKLRIY